MLGLYEKDRASYFLHGQSNPVSKLLWIQWICKFCLIYHGSLKVKLESFFRDVSVLKLCELNTNYAIKFCRCSGKKNLPDVCQKMLSRDLVKH